MKYIKIGRCFAKKHDIAIVDDSDDKLISGLNWSMHIRGYAVSWLDGKNILMHRLIMKPSKDIHIDHIDGNKLNNQKSNLRFVTISQNNKNLMIRTDNTSGYKGVSWDTARNKWFAKITSDKKQIPLGRFTDIKEAVRVYNKAALKYHGEFAWTNPL